MIRFCPNDGTLLMVATGRCPSSNPDDLAFVCEVCPYTHPVPASPLVAAAPTRARPRADVLGGDEAWANVQKTDGTACPKCGHGSAYFFEVQTRSADEPATLFLRCVRCTHQWRESP